MDQFYFIGTITVVLGVAIFWGFKTLPKEKWQILAVLPREKSVHGKWKGLNLTYYGLLCANAYAFAVTVFLILTASAGIPVAGLCALIAALLAVCIPASKIIARLVEKKTGTLTVGGAVFTGTVLAPCIVFLVNHTLGRSLGFEISFIIFLSAAAISYTFGEGMGRLACVSFGCCYGKPVSQCSPFVQRVFSRFYLVFFGKTKKIAYASGFDGEKILPIQIITAVLYSVTGITGTWLFLNGYYAAALMAPLIITQVWRFVSEFFRADFRGTRRITPYQLMSLATILYAAGITLFLSGNAVLPDLSRGLHTLWSPWIIFLIESVWLVSFIHTGRSVVTGSELSFHVVHNKI